MNKKRIKPLARHINYKRRKLAKEIQYVKIRVLNVLIMWITG